MPLAPAACLETDAGDRPFMLCYPYLLFNLQICLKTGVGGDIFFFLGTINTQIIRELGKAPLGHQPDEKPFPSGGCSAIYRHNPTLAGVHAANRAGMGEQRPGCSPLASKPRVSHKKPVINKRQHSLETSCQRQAKPPQSGMSLSRTLSGSRGL